MRLQSAWLALLGLAVSSNAIPITEAPRILPRQTRTTPPAVVDVTQTVTVTSLIQNFSPTTVGTIVFRTLTSTIVVTSTAFATTTVTSSNVDTATVTNYVTSTVLAKRTLGLPEVTGPDGPQPTDAKLAGPMITAAPWSELDLVRREQEHYGLLEKRATIIRTVVVTIIADSITTIFQTGTSTVIRTTTSNFITTSLLTSVTFANAKTTTTVTSTLTITSTSVDTSPPQTVSEVTSTGNFGPSVTGLDPPATTTPGGGDTGGGSGGGSGLSTGAIAGIGGGVGAVALIAIIAGIVWWWKKHSASKAARAAAMEDMRGFDPFDPSRGMEPSPLNVGMSEVPVGLPVGAAAVGRRGRTPEQKFSPSVSPLSSHDTPGHDSNQGWRRPTPMSELSETRPLPAELDYNERRVAEMDNTQARPLAAEMDSTQARPLAAEMGDTQTRPYTAEMDSNPPMTHHSRPGDDVYEMPSQRYR